MFLSAKTFKIDTLIPTVQTTAVVAVNEVLGRLNQYSVTRQSATLITGVSALVSAVVQNLFDNKILRYAFATTVGVGSGFIAHQFFYPAASSIDPRFYLGIGATLFVVRLTSDLIQKKPAAPVTPAQTVTT